ncbi:MAG: fatty acid desaturase [Methylacidiphilales bacterium]|nr:fatty acid desaturase [Candidatus Methylacidiphilales bacterium]
MILIDFLSNGITGLDWPTGLLLTALSCHITLLGVTVYLHRCECHLALTLHPAVKYFFRFWLWLTTAMSTRAWVAIHRKHHARVETQDDPHSPFVYGIRVVLLQGAELYRKEAKNQETLNEYGHNTPDDWLERNIFYGKRNRYGIFILLGLYILIFGAKGVTFWALQMMCIPFLAAGVINGLGHYFGYRNFNTPDGSTNIVPLAWIICGEELHNNHHAYPSSAKFSLNWWEFDLGWLYIQALQFIGLAKIKKTVPRVMFDYSKLTLDTQALKAVFNARMHVVANYIQTVIKPLLSHAESQATHEDKIKLRALKKQLMARDIFSKKIELDSLLVRYPRLSLVWQFKQQLDAIWNSKFENQERLLVAMGDWCTSAEKSNVPELKGFVRMLCAYQVEAHWK